jgi:hypothetical protein
MGMATGMINAAVNLCKYACPPSHSFETYITKPEGYNHHIDPLLSSIKEIYCKREGELSIGAR